MATKSPVGEFGWNAEDQDCYAEHVLNLLQWISDTLESRGMARFTNLDISEDSGGKQWVNWDIEPCGHE